MRAGVIKQEGGVPQFAEFREPSPREGAVFIEVDTAGLGGWDVLGAYRMGVAYPCVVRGEGVGRAEDGRRVYFGERSDLPFGAFAERTVVPIEEAWDVPDDVDDRTAITAAIAGTGAWVPLEQAKIQKGESVLILGATGVLGQLGLQYARVLGAGRVVGAGRNQAALDRLMARGIADAVVKVGTADDAAALKAEAGDGFDVVLDMVYGPPMVAALKATRWGARVMTVGAGAGMEVPVHIADLLYRTLTVVGTGQFAPARREAIWRELLALAAKHNIDVDYLDYPLEKISDAWAAQIAGPHAKITTTIRG